MSQEAAKGGNDEKGGGAEGRFAMARLVSALPQFRFLLFVAPAVGILFIAAALAPDEPSEISSWREHYYRIHRQLVGATLFFWFAVAVANAILLQPFNLVEIVPIASLVVILAPALVTKNAQEAQYLVLTACEGTRAPVLNPKGRSVCASPPARRDSRMRTLRGRRRCPRWA